MERRDSSREKVYACEGLEPRQTTILLVEDERFVREVAAEILESGGYRVYVARNAKEALRLFHRAGGHLDLLLTDIVLPGKSGAQLSEELEIDCPKLRTIYMSGYPETVANFPPNSSRALYLAKPFSVNSLTAKVRQALGYLETANIELNHASYSA